MPFQPGQPRPEGAGRKKGAKNKKKVMRVEDVLVEKGVNPVEEILKTLPDLKPAERVETLLKLIPYYQPLLKAVEHGGFDPEDDGEFEDLPEAAVLALAKVK